jgi:hypothetical protein
MILVQTRAHPQKGKDIFFVLNTILESFKRLFSVLDAVRVNKKRMEEMMGKEKLAEYVEKYALYSIDLV